MSEGGHQWCQRLEKHLWGEQVNLHKEDSEWPSVLLPQHKACIDCCGSLVRSFCCSVSSLGSQMLPWDSQQQHLRQSSVKKWMSSNGVDFPKGSVPDVAAGTSAV